MLPLPVLLVRKNRNKVTIAIIIRPMTKPSISRQNAGSNIIDPISKREPAKSNNPITNECHCSYYT